MNKCFTCYYNSATFADLNYWNSGLHPSPCNDCNDYSEYEEFI